MLFPRLLAVAERAWHKASWENDFIANDGNSNAEKDMDWAMFANKIGFRELVRLEQLGVKYRVSLPGAV